VAAQTYYVNTAADLSSAITAINSLGAGTSGVAIGFQSNVTLTGATLPVLNTSRTVIIGNTVNLSSFTINANGGPGLVITNGTVNFSNMTLTNAAGALTIGSGANVTFNGNTTISGNGSTSGSAISLQGNGTLNFSTNGTISGNITDQTGSGSGTGSWSLSHSGGTLVLTGNNTYSGGTTINGGLINFNSASNFGSGQITIRYGTLQWAAGNTTDISARLASIPIGGPGATFDTNGNNVTFATSLNGNGFTKTGAGTLTLTAPVQWVIAPSGVGTELSVTGGTLKLAGAGSLNFPGGIAPSDGFQTANLVTVSNGAALDLGGTTAGAVQLIVPSGTIQNGTLNQYGVDAGGQGNVTISANIAGEGNFKQYSSDPTQVTVLSGANTYTGNTWVFGGTLQIAGAGTLGSTSGSLLVSGTSGPAGLSGDTLTTTGVLDLGGTTQTQNGGVTLGGRSYTTAVVSGVIQNGTLSSSGVFNLMSGTVSASLAGTGSLIKSDIGTVVLSGANSYTGGTTVAGGTLQIAGTGTLGSTGSYTSVSGSGILDLGGTTQTQNGGVILSSGGTIQNGTLSSSGGFNLQSGTITANLAGSGSATVSGGTVILDGVNTYTGGTTVTGGSTLQIGDLGSPAASVAGPVTVNASGALTGVGSIGGSLTNVGYVSPGASSPLFTLSGVIRGGTLNGGSRQTGTLSVGGSYAQGTSGILSIGLSPGAASKLAVGGSAALGGTLNLPYNLGTYTPGTVYQILTAGGGVSGTFGAVTTSNQPLGVSATPSYLPNEVDVTLVPTGSGSLTSGLSAQAAVLSSASLAGQTLFSHLDQVGQGTDGVFTATAETSPVQVAFAGNAEDLGAVLAQVPDTFARYGGWFRATGTFANVNNQGSIAGYHSSAGAFLAGFDRQLSPNLMAGIAGGYGHSSAHIHDDGGSSETVDTPRGFLYGRYAFPTVYIDGSLGYAYDTFDLTRPVTNTGTTATSRHDGQEVSLSLLAGRPIALGWATLTPKLGFQYLHLTENGYTESGAGANNLTVAGHDTESFRPLVGANVDRQFTTEDGTRIVPEARLSYSHELLNVTHEVTEQDASSSPTTVVGLNPARNILGLGTGLAIAATDRLSLYADYDADLSPGSATVQTVSAGLRVHF
jgi:fibronectin-binding autotransporter adhesin